MFKLRRFSAAFALSAVIGTGMVLHSKPAYAGTPGYCKALVRGIAAATENGHPDLAAYLQSIYNAHCL